MVGGLGFRRRISAQRNTSLLGAYILKNSLVKLQLTSYQSLEKLYFPLNINSVELYHIALTIK
jgi:hypothetical protein